MGNLNRIKNWPLLHNVSRFIDVVQCPAHISSSTSCLPTPFLLLSWKKRNFLISALEISPNRTTEGQRMCLSSDRRGLVASQTGILESMMKYINSEARPVIVIGIQNESIAKRHQHQQQPLLDKYVINNPPDMDSTSSPIQFHPWLII